MATGYTRQSSGVIINGDTINASDFNNEFNQLQSAFDVTAGHTHDGTSGGGAQIVAASFADNTITLGKIQQLTALSVLGVTGSSTANMAAITGTANQVLIVNNAGTALAFGTASLTAGVTGILPVANGGTGVSSVATQTANTVWAGPPSGSAATPTFRVLVGTDLPNPSSSTLGGIKSAVSVSNQWINSISTSGVPSLSQPAFTDISGSVASTQVPALTGDTTASAGTTVTTTVKVNGVAYGTSPSTNTVPVVTGSNTITYETVPVAAGGTGAISLTAHGILLGEGTSAITPTAVMSNGQLLVGQSASDPLPKTVSGDATLAATGALTVTKTNGTAFGTAAIENLGGSIIDDGSGNLKIANSGVTATSYTNANITIAADGRVTAASNGSAGAFSAKFTSSQQAISTVGTLIQVAHGLGAAPFGVIILLHCISADTGYSIGDEVVYQSAITYNGTFYSGYSIFSDATNVNLRMSGASNALTIAHKSSGAITSITNANWTIIIKAWV